MLMFEEQLIVDIPDSFQEMEKGRAARLYPYDERPQIILEDEKMSRLCTFSLLTSQGLTAAQVEYAVKSVSQVVTGLYPSCLLESPRTMECKGGNCGWFAFRSIGNQGEMFHVMYIFPVNGYMMLGTMGCMATDEIWKEQLWEIVKSMEAVRKKTSYIISARERRRREGKETVL